MMRGRIVAQGFTIMALLTGIMVSVRESLPYQLAKRLINLFQMSKNTWVPPTSDPNGQVIKLTQLYILRLLGVSTFRSMTHRSFSC